MATSNPPATSSQQDDPGEGTIVEIDEQLLRQFGEMAVAIPSDDGSGTDDILRKILSARTWDDLDAPWETSDVSDLAGKTLHITKVTRRPSRKRGGLGIFLVVHMTDAKTGQEHVKTTGSVSVVGQLAWLYFKGATAVTVKWHRADEPTEGGFYPQHLEIVDAHVPDSQGA